MVKDQDAMMMDVAMEWNDLMNDVEEEDATLFSDLTDFTDRVKYLTFMVEAYQRGTPLHLAKLSWNDQVDGAGDAVVWKDRVSAAMNFAVAWLREKLAVQD